MAESKKIVIELRDQDLIDWWDALPHKRDVAIAAFRGYIAVEQPTAKNASVTPEIMAAIEGLPGTFRAILEAVLSEKIFIQSAGQAHEEAEQEDLIGFLTLD